MDFQDGAAQGRDLLPTHPMTPSRFEPFSIPPFKGPFPSSGFRRRKADFPQFLGVIETTHHKLLSVRRGENSRYRRPLPNVGNAGVAVSNKNPKIARGRFRPALLRRRSNMPSISWS